MAVRGDISVKWDSSPRVILVASPSTEVTIQDLHDTLRSLEDDLANMDNPRLIATAGKEDLGGSTSVGLTATLQNAVLGFEQRVVSLETGTVTTPDTNGLTLTDSAATFVTNGVAPGDMVANYTDGSHATVLRVNSETQLTLLTALSGGTDNQFDSADSYEVFDWVQCSVDGGNLVAVDTADTAIDPIFPTFGTQVVRTSSSSATLSDAAGGAGLSDVQDTVVTAVEYQRGHHTAEVFLFVDPVTGSDSNSGLTRATAKQTINGAIAAIAQEHTAIVVLGSGTGQQVFNENIVLSTRFTFLRGPGLDVKLAGSAMNTPTVQITATGCEVSGFEITTPGTGTGEAIDVDADFTLLRELRISDAVQDGIDMSGGHRSRIENCIVENAGRYGIHISNTSFAFIGNNTRIVGSGSDNFRIQPGAGSADDTVIQNITSTNSGGYGIFIGAGCNRTRISDAAFIGTGLGKIQDDGTDTIFDDVVLVKKMLINKLELADGSSNNWILYDDDDVTPLLTFSVTDKDGLTISQPTGAPSRRTRGV